VVEFGRHAWLRAMCLMRACRFKSGLRHHITKKSRAVFLKQCGFLFLVGRANPLPVFLRLQLRQVRLLPLSAAYDTAPKDVGQQSRPTYPVCRSLPRLSPRPFVVIPNPLLSSRTRSGISSATNRHLNCKPCPFIVTPAKAGSIFIENNNQLCATGG
jgi:hypothetical protein